MISPASDAVGFGVVAGSAAVQRRTSRWRTVIILLGIWSLCVTLVGFLWLRHAAIASRNAPASSGPAHHEPRPSVIDEPSSSPDSDPWESTSASNFDEVRAHAIAWVAPIAKDAPSLLDRNAALEVTAHDHILGTNKAKVTLMLFGDLNCPYTLRTFKTLRSWLDEQPTAFRLVWRHRPLDIHPGASQAALIAEQLALRQSEYSFWQFVFALSELNALASDADLGKLQEALQSRPSKLDEAAANARSASNLERDRLIALSYAIHATPTLFVNGLRLEGEISRAHLEQMVSEERAEVEALLDDSVPAAKTYTIRVDANLLELDRE